MPRPVAFAFLVVYLWLVMILFGAIVFETLIIYPDIFHDVPRSFEAARAFMTVRGPSDFFPPVGMLSLLTGLGTSALAWRVGEARSWIVTSLILLFLGEFVLSAAFFWPRNTVMFGQGTAFHSDAYLRQIAQEFQTGHWLRVAVSAAAAALSFVGLLRFHRHWIGSGAT